MTNLLTHLFALGYLLALAVGVFAMSAFDVSPMVRSMAMGIPIAMLAGLTWSAASVRRVTVAAALWVSFAGFAVSMLLDWRTWEYLGIAAPLAPLLGAWLANRDVGPVVAAVDQFRRAA